MYCEKMHAVIEIHCHICLKFKYNEESIINPDRAVCHF